MENFKLNLDRSKLSSEAINSRQNFDQVLTKFKASNPPIYKNPWFWGSAGLASVGLATMISLNAMSNQKPKDDKIITQAKIDLPKDTECIKPPVKNEDIPFDSFIVDPSKDEKITLESGTTIEIAKGSLIAQKPVEIQVREFRDKASAFVAGIPMDSKNNTAFESAGMIEIRGVQDHKIVSINPAKPIEVELKTTQNPKDFQFWNLDEKTGVWETYPAEKILSNSSNKAEIKSIPKNLKESKKVLEQKIDNENQIVAQTQVELKKLDKPLLEDFKIPIEGKRRFDLDFDKTEYPELAKFENLVFEIVPTSGYDPSFSKKNWINVELNKQKNRYIMRFESNSEPDFNIEVRPILEGKELKSAEKEFDLAIEDYKSTKSELELKIKETQLQQKRDEAELKVLLKKLEKEIEKSATESRVLEAKTRNTDRMVTSNLADIDQMTGSMKFQTNAWGLFNCDNPIAYPKALDLELPILMSGNDAKFDEIYVFNLQKNNRYVYYKNHPTQSISNLGLHKNDDLVLIGIKYDGAVGYMELKNRPKSESLTKLTFIPKNHEIKTLDLLKKLLNENTIPA